MMYLQERRPDVNIVNPDMRRPTAACRPNQDVRPNTYLTPLVVPQRQAGLRSAVFNDRSDSQRPPNGNRNLPPGNCSVNGNDIYGNVATRDRRTYSSNPVAARDWTLFGTTQPVGDAAKRTFQNSQTSPTALCAAQAYMGSGRSIPVYPSAPRMSPAPLPSYGSGARSPSYRSPKSAFATSTSTFGSPNGAAFNQMANLSAR